MVFPILSLSYKIDATARVKFLSKAGTKETRNHIEFIACGVLLDKKKPLDILKA